MTEPEVAVTHLANKWSLVEVGAQSVSIGPDNLLNFARHISSEEVPDLIAAVIAAAAVASAPRPVTEAPPAPAGPQHRGAIGRRKSRRQLPQPAQPGQAARQTTRSQRRNQQEGPTP